MVIVGRQESPNARGDVLEPMVVDSIRQRLLQSNPTALSCCIYRVPYCLWKVDEKAFHKRVVTLGPLSLHGTVQAIEEQKWRYLQEAISATASHGGGFERLLREIKSWEKSARKFYSETFDDIKRKQFIKIMLLDSCFIIHVLLKETGHLPITPDDPIFLQRWLFREVKRDLLLLENQIPFFLLERLFHLIASSQGICVPLLSVVQEFFSDKMKSNSFGVDNPLHLLHIFHSNLFPQIDGRRSKASVADFKPFPGATQLLAAGVEFRSCGDHRLGIRFEDGVVEIPHLTIEDETKSLLVNLSAFEKLYPYSRPQVSAYIFFMRCLINTVEDVAALCRKGIIDNCLGSDQTTADLFRELRRGIAVYPDEVYVADVIREIRKYYSIRRNAWWARLRHRYSNKPWLIFIQIAAIILLVLAFLQAFLAALSHFHPTF